MKRRLGRLAPAAALVIALVASTGGALRAPVVYAQMSRDVQVDEGGAPSCDDRYCSRHVVVTSRPGDNAKMYFVFDIKVARHGTQILWGEHWRVWGDGWGPGDNTWTEPEYSMNANAEHTILRAYATAVYHTNFQVGSTGASKSTTVFISCTLWSRDRNPHATCKDGP